MKIFFLQLLVLASFAILNPIYAAAGSSPVNIMNAILETNDVASFVEATHREKWSAPVIYSKWHVDNLMSATNRDAAITAREFGKLLAIRIKDLAQKNRTTQESQTLFRQNLILLDLADWLNESEGYGNFLLGARCLDVVAVAMVCCVADEAFPLESVRKIAPRLRPSWMNPSVRQRILNNEAGSPLFHSPESDAAKIQEHLRLVWQAGRELKLQASITDTNLQRELAQRPTRAERERPEMKANVRFFEDENFAGQGATTEGKWDLKRHEEIIRKNPSSISTVEKIVVFRKTLGTFPRKGGVKYVDDMEGEKAFGWAWALHGKDDESRQIGIAVWEAYRDIQRGEFLDEDSRNVETKARLDRTISEEEGVSPAKQ